MTSNMPTGFEYSNKKGETPFETFLRYTDEKEKSSAQLAKVMQDVRGASILDIGTGNGEYLNLSLSKVKDLTGVNLTLVEPSTDLVKQLKSRFDAILPEASIKIINSDLENFTTEEKFDIVLASHLFYHIPRVIWTDQLKNMLSLLKPDGRLILVLREKDDAYDFKMAFKPLLFDKSFQALTIDDILATVPEAGKLSITKYPAASELRIPLEENLEDTISIIEFYLNKQWPAIPKNIQQDALGFIKARSGVFKQLDGIAVIKQN